MKVLYFDCFSGAAGDMILGALIDAGAAEDEVRRALAALDVTDWDLRLETVSRAGLRATKATVTVSPGPPARSHREIRDIIERAPLPSGIRQRALETFRMLAEAEARVHGSAAADVHLHEAGAVDAIVDIVGSAAALEQLNARLVITSPIATGRGLVNSAHGPIPVPAPAVTELLAGATLVERGTNELVTPTGAAILAAATDRFGSMPAMTLASVGYGAGERDLEIPNVLRVLVGEANEEGASRTGLVIECNLDDMSPELVPYVIERLMAAGAQDAWTTPIVMKKGRPALTLAVLTSPDAMDALLHVLFTETTTLGLRIAPVEKRELEREWLQVDVEGYAVRVKLGRMEGRVTTAAPEYEDALKVARLTSLPLKEVYRRALANLPEPT
ncbi:MAG: nickel pincer cofactor biosynthesis protein LarC [Actinomycetota bacterium]